MSHTHLGARCVAGGRRQLLLMYLALAVVPDLASPPQSARAAADPQQSVEDARSALGSRFSGPEWYDATNDRPKPLPLPEIRERSFKPRTGGISLDWLSGVAWGLLAVAIAVIVYLIVRAFVLSPKDRDRTGNEAAERAPRVEALPLDLDWSAGDLLTMASRLRSEGNFRQAMIYLYSHTLLELDRCQAIRLAKGKTNRQYAGELKRWAPAAYEPFGEGIVAFEDVFFGEREIDRERLDHVWTQLEQALTTAAAAGVAA